MEPPVLDMASVVEDSSTRTPLIFVLSPGVVSLSAETKYCLSVFDFLRGFQRVKNSQNIFFFFGESTEVGKTIRKRRWQSIKQIYLLGIYYFIIFYHYLKFIVVGKLQKH